MPVKGSLAASGQITDGGLWEEAPPDPAATIESLRHLGYDTASALADLIDNSIAAGARNIGVRRYWAGADSWQAVIDDGRGMTEGSLRQAMRIGSRDPLDVRADGDLGRYGFGLKTASFSQAREITVSSRHRPGGPAVIRCWDLDQVRKTGRWQLRRTAPPAAAAILSRMDPGTIGSIVLWRSLSDLADDHVDDDDARKRFNTELEHISRWLGMVFERFLTARDPVVMTLNGERVRGWDPFLRNHAATQPLPVERLLLHGSETMVSPYVLPHASNLTALDLERAAGPRGWNDQQGFYVYRRNRLITAGDWLGLGLSRDDAHNLARIAIEVPVDLDGQWQLDITKASVRPPGALRNDLLRVAKATRRRAKATLRHRGTVVSRAPRRKIDQVWVQRSVHGRSELRINRQHPLVANLLEEAGLLGSDLRALLSLVEEALPTLLLPTDVSDWAPLQDRPPEQLLALADGLYETLLRKGMSRAEAAQRICHTEPFHLYPSILEHFGAHRG
jgi:Histidine kinase-, DNA gyrase B-, and HSP90-like ATPase